MNSLFPHDEIRDQQDKLLVAVGRTCQNGGQLVVHAPTGLGKTAAALSPAVKYAIDEKKTVVFLTSRHTQHKLALETLGKIKQRHGKDFDVVDIVGKKWLCLQPNAERLRSREFAEYCRALREDKQCDFYEQLRKGEELSKETKLTLKELGASAPNTTQQVKESCAKTKLCPYEISLLLARKAVAIVTDYSYLFNPGIRDTFLAKIGKQLEDLIIIVDEAHNLPERSKDAASERLSTFALTRAISEAEKFKYEELEKVLRGLKEALERYGLTIEEGMEERYVEQQDILRKIGQLKDPQQLAAALMDAGDAIREQQQSSSLGAIGAFIQRWIEGDDEGYVRIFSEGKYKDEPIFTVHYRCLDPSVVTGEVLNGAHASVMMSGTLSPTRMYKELLGVLKAEELSLTSPFPSANRMTIIVPRTTTKFTARSGAMYKEIASHCSKIVDAVPGNTAVFFPSYKLLEDVRAEFMRVNKKVVFAERQGMTKDEKHDFLENFKVQKDQGAVLMGVISGNFGEGIDLPGDELKCVVVVGLPLGKPTLETKALINHFDNKFGRGWEYGYTFPAFNKTLQSAGRCIRTETDRGALVFLDERYDHANYKRCFPEDWDLRTTVLYEQQLRKFFEQDRKNKTLEEFE